MKSQQSAVTVCLAILLTTVVAAHPNYRIIGVVTRITPDIIEVRQTKDGAIIAMTMDSETIVTRDKKKVSRSLVKAGQYVVVDACGDSLKDLLVMEIKLVPDPATKG